MLLFPWQYATSHPRIINLLSHLKYLHIEIQQTRGPNALNVAPKETSRLTFTTIKRSTNGFSSFLRFTIAIVVHSYISVEQNPYPLIKLNEKLYQRSL